MNDYRIPGTAMCHIPLFMPWIQMIGRIACSETFVITDNVQYQSKYLDNRTKIAIWKKNELKWLTISTEGSTHQTVREVRITGRQTLIDAVHMFESNYSPSPYFHHYWDRFKEELLDASDDCLLYQLNLKLLKIFFDVCDVQFPTVIESSSIYTGADRNERLVEICKHLDNHVLLSGWGKGKEVHDLNHIQHEGINCIPLNEEMVRMRIADGFLREGLTAFHVLCMRGEVDVRRCISEIREVYLHEIKQRGIQL